MPRVTLFLPMHDERDSLLGTAAKAQAVLSGVTPDYELLIVDDGSRDGSELIADRLAAADARVRVLRHEQNRGYGQALCSGFAAARGEVVAYTDCDEPADLALLPAFLARFDDPAVDMVIGYRTARNGDGLVRLAYSATYNALVRALFGVRVRDVNFAFKLVRRAALAQVRLSAHTAFIDGQLLAEARRLGLRLVELPVEYRPRRFGQSHFNSPRAAFVTLREMLGYFWKRRG